jgi:hypothetical protein
MCEDTVQEEMLFCCLCKEYATGRDIFSLYEACFNEAEVEWFHCICVCTDEVSSMKRKYYICSTNKKRCYSKHPLDMQGVVAK